MPNKDNALFPRLKVMSCPSCNAKYKKPLEPHILTEAPEVPGVGLTCPDCGHKIEWVILNALPMQIDHINACFGAMCQLVKVAWITGKKIDVGWLKEYRMLKEWAPTLLQMREALEGMGGVSDAES